MVIAMAIVASSAQAQATKPLAHVAAPAPIVQAKIDRAAAEKTALQRVPGGTIKSGELENEHGLLIWSFDIAQTNSRDIKEVQVDAVSGKVVSIVTETPKDQAREAAAEQKKKTAHKN
jgi:uncharacterized membrane protein YkoI